MTGNESTYCFRVFGERWFDGSFKKPCYKYVTANSTKMAYNIINYLNPDKNIIRVDHLKEETLNKLLDYDVKKHGGISIYS